MIDENEIRRLLHGPRPDEDLPEPVLVRLRAHCRGNAADVLARCREVLEVMLREDPARWPTVEEWRAKLPGWFVATCRKREMTVADEKELTKLARGNWPRTVGNFVHWFKPHMRNWSWWNAQAASPDLLILEFSVRHYLARDGLDWLLKVAGARPGYAEYLDASDRSDARQAAHLASQLSAWLRVLGIEDTDAAVDLAYSIAAAKKIDRLVARLLALRPEYPEDAHLALGVTGELYDWLFTELRWHLDQLEQNWDTLEGALRKRAGDEDEEDGDV
jgi:hypothetical protein